jgi:FKBP-type peptidyl-prolyl cis-trans isomerase
MKNYQFLLLTGLSLILITSCKLDDSAELRDKETRVFQSYLEENNITVEPTASGLYYVEEVQGEGLSPEIGDFCLIKYEITLVYNELLIYTYDEQKAMDKDIYNSRTLYGPAKLYVGANLRGLDEGLMLMKPGGKARLIFTSDLGHGGNSVGSIPAYTSLIIDVEMLEVIVDPAASERDKLQGYLNINEIYIDSTNSGLYYWESIKGEGDTASLYASLKLTFKSSLLDGRVIFEKDTVYFNLGTINNTITEGLTEGLSYMKEGGAATIIAPYYLAHGAAGKSYYNDDGIGKVPIPPYTTMVYEVELIEVN